MFMLKNTNYSKGLPLSLTSFTRLFPFVFFCLIITSFVLPVEASSKPIIAITQITAHDSLDRVRAGILARLQKHGYVDGKTAEIHFDNAFGSPTVQVQIAKKIVSLDPDIAVAISTLSAQCVVAESKNASLPIIFSSVTDPIQARLVSDLKKPGAHVTGVRNAPPLADIVQLTKTLLPQVKRIGTLINAGEVNSVSQSRELAEIAHRAGLSCRVIEVKDVVDGISAMQALSKSVDAVVLLQDNMVASTLPTLMQVAHEASLPVLSTYREAVTAGALFSLAFDEFAVGEQTGEMVARVLSGVSPAAMPVEDPHKLELVFNTDMARHFKVQPSRDFLKQVNHFIGKQLTKGEPQ